MAIRRRPGPAWSGSDGHADPLSELIAGAAGQLTEYPAAQARRPAELALAFTAAGSLTGVWRLTPAAVIALDAAPEVQPGGEPERYPRFGN